MRVETVDIKYSSEANDYRKRQDEYDAAIKKIESDGGYVVGEEPIELIFVKIVGRRFTVEYKEV